MAGQLEKSNATEAEERKAPEIGIRSARLDAREIGVGDLITLDEIRLMGTNLAYRPGPGGALKVEHLEATLVVTESAFNRYLEKNVEEPFSELQGAMLNGKMRLTGRYRLLLPIPFTVTAVPEIEGGARLRLDTKHMSLVGAPIPGFGVEMVGDKINQQLGKAFDATRLPIPLRLTKITVETGRILLHAVTSLEIAAK